MVHSLMLVRIIITKISKKSPRDEGFLIPSLIACYAGIYFLNVIPYLLIASAGWNSS